MEISHQYDDIIRLPHHVSEKHPRMSMNDRAAQFAPFSALTGYEDVIAETGRPTEWSFELDEQEAAELNRRLAATAILKRVISIAGETENAVRWNVKFSI